LLTESDDLTVILPRFSKPESEINTVPFSSAH
jgi:hypothetical protein